jgi:glycosyltransferase involved in cell wall biosynthesis
MNSKTPQSRKRGWPENIGGVELKPLVSVVVTTYNQAAYIEETLKSVFAQTYEPYEVIVVDDGSTDDTPSRIASFNDSVIYVRQKNQGVAGSRNTGIRKARGEFIAFLDGDDLWEPEKLSIQVAEARRYPNSGLIVVDGLMFDNSGIISTTLFCGAGCKDLADDSVTSGRYYHKLLHGPFISTTSQVMVPAKVFETVGMSNRKFKGASDYDLYIRIAAKFDVTIIKKRLTRWRYLATSVSGPRSLRVLRYLPEDIAILKNHLRESRGNDRTLIRRIFKSKLAGAAESLYHYGLEADKVFATRVLLKLLVENPASPAAAVFLAGLWCPGAVKNKLAPVVRRMLFRNGSA